MLLTQWTISIETDQDSMKIPWFVLEFCINVSVWRGA